MIHRYDVQKLVNCENENVFHVIVIVGGTMIIRVNSYEANVARRF